MSLTVPVRQKWLRLRFPFHTVTTWDEAVGSGAIPPGPIGEREAEQWCRWRGLSYVWLGHEDIGVPAESLLSRFDGDA